MLYGPGVKAGVVTDENCVYSEDRVRHIAAQKAKRAVDEYAFQQIIKDSNIINKILQKWDPVKDMEDMTGIPLK